VVTAPRDALGRMQRARRVSSPRDNLCARPAVLAAYAALGVARVMALLPRIEDSDEPLHEYIEAGHRVGAGVPLTAAAGTAG